MPQLINFVQSHHYFAEKKNILIKGLYVFHGHVKCRHLNNISVTAAEAIELVNQEPNCNTMLIETIKHYNE